MSRKRDRSPTLETTVFSEQVFLSEPIKDRESTFLGLYSPTLSAKRLQATPDIESASHKIVAWRKSSTQQTLSSKQSSSQQLFDVGSDDDSEKWAGKKLENLLVNLKVEGAVVVARWYGGVMLGPVRFTHMETCAKEAIVKCQEARKEAQKRQKIDVEEAEDKIRLEQILAERDKSIVVLRQLLTDKRNANATDTVSSSAEAGKPSLAQPIDYAKIPLQALKRLEKARDATLVFILKEIDKLEADNAQDK